jgi:hypothetical protein
LITIVVTTPILDHRDDHYVTPNKVAFKYPNFNKDVDPNAHVKVFNYVVKVNAKTFEKYIINAFSYMLKDITSKWCNNYMLEFLDCIFLELTQAFCNHQRTQNDKQIYMELKNMSMRRLRGWRFTMSRFRSHSWFTSTNHIQFNNYYV